MAAVQEKESKQTKDVRDLMEYLEKLTSEERNQVKGVAIGMVMVREARKQPAESNA